MTKEKYLKPHFQKNKDWNLKIAEDEIIRRYLKPHFQKNKDWNKSCDLLIDDNYQLKTPLPEKQGLKQMYIWGII